MLYQIENARLLAENMVVIHGAAECNVKSLLLIFHFNIHSLYSMKNKNRIQLWCYFSMLKRSKYLPLFEAVVGVGVVGAGFGFGGLVPFITIKVYSKITN